MPIFMDVHIVPGVKAKDVAEAHRKDLLHQGEHGCNCMTYWIDEARENIFCLIEAPTREAVIEMHNKAHGLVPNKVIEVNSSLVESFLGRIYDPSNAVTNEEGLKIFSDPSFRILLVTKTEDMVLLQHVWGAEKTNAFIEQHNDIIRKNIAAHGGSEAEHRGAGFIISFSSAVKALACAVSIQKEMKGTDAGAARFKIAINAGEPVEKSNKLFGDTILLASQLCSVAGEGQIALASDVKELLTNEKLPANDPDLLTLTPRDEDLLQRLLSELEAHWHDPDFDVEDYCKVLAMSKSQFYRKTTALTGLSPNQLLKEFRLEHAKELMKKKRYNISQITFESGFTSPSYFTKCFKKKYGLLPMAYLDLLH